MPLFNDIFKQISLSVSTVIYPVNFLPIYILFLLLYDRYVIICIHFHPVKWEKNN